MWNKGESEVRARLFLHVYNNKKNDYLFLLFSHIFLTKKKVQQRLVLKLKQLMLRDIYFHQINCNKILLNK
jgi:hypothetical protein